MWLRSVLLALVAVAGSVSALQAQQYSNQRGGGQNPFVSPDHFREQFNENTLFLMGGPLGQSDIAYAADIATVLDDGRNLRVLPIVGAAAVQNVKDVLFLRGVDLALTDATTLNALQRSKDAGPNLERQIAYISVLYPQEMHVLARSGIATLQDLRGKTVNFDVSGSGSALHLPGIFEALGIEVHAVNIPQLDALEKMRRGDLDATICICAKPVSAFLTIQPEWGFRLLGVPYEAALQGDLLPAPISGQDYPSFLAPDTLVDTVATTAVLIAFNWPKESTRYNRTAKFVSAFFSRFPELLKRPRQPGWQTVNLAAKLPGWQRFAPAEEWLARNHKTRTSTVQAEFEKFAAERKKVGFDPSQPGEEDRLFRAFLEWSQRTN